MTRLFEKSSCNIALAPNSKRVPKGEKLGEVDKETSGLHAESPIRPPGWGSRDYTPLPTDGCR